MTTFHFRQNNSGGSFHIDNNVSIHVFIDAESEDKAMEKAEDIGIYFDGCMRGIDCDCCGDRWYGCNKMEESVEDFMGCEADFCKSFTENHHGVWHKENGDVVYFANLDVAN